MRPLIQEVRTQHTPETLAASLLEQPGLVLLRSALSDPVHGRYSFVLARPVLTLRSFGSRCVLETNSQSHVQFGDPWRILDELMARFEVPDEVDMPFPLGGCFGYWGYDLKNFVEPTLPRRVLNDLGLPDCHLGFYESLVVFDHSLARVLIVATGLEADGSRSASRAARQAELWHSRLSEPAKPEPHTGLQRAHPGGQSPDVRSNLSERAYIDLVRRAQRYIRSGDIYQVNLCQRLTTAACATGWDFYQHLAAVSPAPFMAYLDAGDFQIASSSPELFLRLSGRQVRTRPIKGTRLRAAEPTRDAQLAYELQTSPKEVAELVMITDLLRNDLGRICAYGSIHAPELLRLERFSQVQHLVSTVEGTLRPEISHPSALASCFPGGSITGAPKIRAMQIIDELEPTSRGPYTGCLGYLGFNRESQVSITIRAAIWTPGGLHFHVGAGIVADSSPEAEYAETLAKAGGFLLALDRAHVHPTPAPHPLP